MRTSYVKTLSIKSEIQSLIEVMDPEEEKLKLVELLARDLFSEPF